MNAGGGPRADVGVDEFLKPLLLPSEIEIFLLAGRSVPLLLVERFGGSRDRFWPREGEEAILRRRYFADEEG